MTLAPVWDEDEDVVDVDSEETLKHVDSTCSSADDGKLSASVYDFSQSSFPI